MKHKHFIVLYNLTIFIPRISVWLQAMPLRQLCHPWYEIFQSWFSKTHQPQLAIWLQWCQFWTTSCPCHWQAISRCPAQQWRYGLSACASGLTLEAQSLRRNDKSPSWRRTNGKEWRVMEQSLCEHYCVLHSVPKTHGINYVSSKQEGATSRQA